MKIQTLLTDRLIDGCLAIFSGQLQYLKIHLTCPQHSQVQLDSFGNWGKKKKKSPFRVPIMFQVGCSDGYQNAILFSIHFFLLLLMWKAEGAYERGRPALPVRSEKTASGGPRRRAKRAQGPARVSLSQPIPLPKENQCKAESCKHRFIRCRKN